jgi:hypothetical protein
MTHIYRQVLFKTLIFFSILKINSFQDGAGIGVAVMLIEIAQKH